MTKDKQAEIKRLYVIYDEICARPRNNPDWTAKDWKESRKVMEQIAILKGHLKPKKKRKSLYSIEQILKVSFEDSGKYLKHNVELLGLGPIQKRRYNEAFASIRVYRNSECYAGPGTGAEALALQTIWGYEKKFNK